MTILLLILLYLIGCLLTLFRIAASEHAIDEKYLIYNVEPSYTSILDVARERINMLFIIFSWMGFIAGIMQYIFEPEEKEKIFIFSYKFKSHDKNRN